MKLVLLLAAISLNAFSAEVCDAPKAFHFEPPIMQAMNAIALEWWSVSPTQYQSAACKNHSPPDFNSWLGSLNGRGRDRTIKGFRLKDQPTVLLDAFRDIVKNLPERESTCDSVLCAVDEIWGPEIGRRILYVRARHGYNTSEHAFPGARQLTTSELNDIMITLSDLPPEMEMIGRGANQPMYLAAAGARHPVDPRASADAGITFYDAWRESSNPFNRQYGLYHEFGHNMAVIRGHLDQSPEWNAAVCPVSTYGETNRVEDFAETFVMYRFHGRGLLEKCPAKYNLLKERVFNNREYLDESQCL